jgi:pimeloyl-ACP methyl ester carboxylesterase
MAATHHKAMANGQTLHYVREGSGPPVLLLHGWPATWTHWRKLMPLLAHKHTVIAPDLRGFGDSSKPPTGYDTRSITGDVRALMQQLDLGKKTLVVGHDMGAVHAYTYAAEYPDEVAAFAYLDEPLPGLSYESFAALKPEPMWQGGFWFAHFHLVPQLPEALTAGRERLYLRHIITRMAYDPSVWSEADFDELERTFGGGGQHRCVPRHCADDRAEQGSDGTRQARAPGASARRRVRHGRGAGPRDAPGGRSRRDGRFGRVRPLPG